MKLIVGSIVLMIFIFCGCTEEPAIVKISSLGRILDADIIPTSFNECQKMKIKTEKAVIIIYAITRVEIGEEARDIEWSNGRHTIEWNSSKHAFFIR